MEYDFFFSSFTTFTFNNKKKNVIKIIIKSGRKYVRQCV